MAQTGPNRSGPVFWRQGENEDWSWSQSLQKGSKDRTGPDLKALMRGLPPATRLHGRDKSGGEVQSDI
jgi:hypothetical protein